ncbi:MAG: glycogen/starch/alpha-glucan phosphorylase [Myxococcaceae bacterium]|nr:glycogen/starch/alpha-glucan phosphorylase [Myxococcaceae bacterium]
MDNERFKAQVNEKDVRLGVDAASLRDDFVKKLFFQQAKFPGVATRNDNYLALSYVVRDRLLLRWVHSARTFLEQQCRTVIYLSAEYLPGPQLDHNVMNLGLTTEVRAALSGMGIDYDELVEHEEEPGLGNGGLGRLAACFMDSLATVEIPAIGHGIRYEFGIFDQQIRDGEQVESTDKWLRLGNPWEVMRQDVQHQVGFGGHTEAGVDELGRFRVKWHPARLVTGIPYDTPVVGHGTTNTNFLRLWSARATDEFDLKAFNDGEYWKAVDEKVRSENISKVLYPADHSLAGKTLRLEQQYFFVSCALQDCIRFLLQKTTIDKFADKFAIQLNDTHPALAVAELMRLFVDVHGLSWERSWEMTQASCSYTNHTLLPEALETWPLPLMQRLLPRHVEIIFEINRRFLDEVRARFPGDDDRVRRMSLIDENGEKSVRMAHLATVGGHMVNGVAALHSRLLIETVLKDFAELWPERFTNVTNGVTPRRFVLQANPRLSALVTDAIGEGWVNDLGRLEQLVPLAEEAEFRRQWRDVKSANKRDFARWVSRVHGLDVDPQSLFDVQIKRIHEYKRQHLAALYAVWTYLRIKNGDTKGLVPRTFFFAGKAAPGYRMAKLIIRFLNALSTTLAKDPRAREWLHVSFVPDFNVKNASHLYPAADLSEQISTAGKEASGTGNMKMALNGALTIGTLDGANVEIREHVGPENFFLFGLTAEEVSERKRQGYSPHDEISKDGRLRQVLEAIADDTFSPGQHGLFSPLVRSLADQDPFLVMADLAAYIECQERVAALWQKPERWTRASVLNTARMGFFSSDRSIREYAERIWRVKPVKLSKLG